MTKTAYDKHPWELAWPDKEHAAWDCVSDSQCVQLATRCAAVHVHFRWWRSERRSLVLKPSSEDTEQNKGNISSSFYIEDPQQTLSKQMPVDENHELSSLWAGLNSRFIGPLPAFYTMVFLLMTNDTKDRDRWKQWPSPGGMRSIEDNSTHHKSLLESLYPRHELTQRFSSVNLNLD